jgi:protein subunit release factor B
MVPMNEDFKQFQMHLYEDIKRLFPEGAVDVLVVRASGPGSKEQPNAAVRLVHRATGITVDCDHYASTVSWPHSSLELPVTRGTLSQRSQRIQRIHAAEH